MSDSVHREAALVRLRWAILDCREAGLSIEQILEQVTRQVKACPARKAVKYGGAEVETR